MYNGKTLNVFELAYWNTAPGILLLEYCQLQKKGETKQGKEEREKEKERKKMKGGREEERVKGKIEGRGKER